MKPGSSHPCLLYVGPRNSPIFEFVIGLCQSLDLDVQSAANVYQASCRLQPSRCDTGLCEATPKVGAVMLQLDFASVHDLEFISLVHRYFPEMPLWVATDQNANSKQALALRLGAAGVINAANARERIGGIREGAGHGAASPSFSNPSDQENAVAESSGAGPSGAEAALQKPTASDRDDRSPKSDADGNGPPVPWARGRQAPQRTPPPKPPPLVSAEQLRTELESEMPLLTEEELEFLINREAQRRRDLASD